MQIRPEQPADYAETESVITAAFLEEVYSDHKEQELVRRIRQSDGFVPELVLDALAEKQAWSLIRITLLSEVMAW